MSINRAKIVPGKLVIEPALLALTLAWAEATDPDNTGVSITHFRSGVGLPSKAHNLQLCNALRDHGLIREALKREGWFRLLTVAEAVEAGNLPAGPWYTPVVAADSAASGVEATMIRHRSERIGAMMPQWWRQCDDRTQRRMVGRHAHKPAATTVARSDALGVLARGNGSCRGRFLGRGALSWLVRLHPWSEYQLMLHRAAWDRAWLWLWYAAIAVLVVVGMAVTWCVAVAVLWQWRFRAVKGQYLELVMPRPVGSSATRTAQPQATAVFWDRLVATLQDVRRGGVPAYLASELWGDASGRVRWGIWLPTHLVAHREPIRRLITAQRSDARLADAVDPLLAALSVGDGADDGERWYATTQLTPACARLPSTRG